MCKMKNASFCSIYFYFQYFCEIAFKILTQFIPTQPPVCRLNFYLFSYLYIFRSLLNNRMANKQTAAVLLEVCMKFFNNHRI